MRSCVHASTTLTIAGLVATLAGCSQLDVPANENQTSTRPIETEVVRVVDGDTVTVAPVADEGLDADERGREEEATVRLLGIDAPEMSPDASSEPECGAQDAARRLTSALPKGTSVKIVHDSRADEQDRFGRTLAYVEKTQDGKAVDMGRWLVAGGFVATWYPTGEPEPGRITEYEKLEKQAQNRGNWPVCDDLGR